MKKNFWRSVLSLLLAVTMCVTLPMSVLAETVSETDPPVENADGTQTVVTTTTTTETDKEGNTTVTVTIDKATEGTTKNGVKVEAKEFKTEVTTSDANGKVTGIAGEEGGTEKKEWTENSVPAGQEVPPVEVELIPGKTTTGSATNEDKPVVKTKGDVPKGKQDVEYDFTKTTIVTNRKVKAETGKVETTLKSVSSSMEGLVSALKFDRNSESDQAANKKERDLYTDNGHFTDPADITVTDAPDGYPFQFVGTGDYSGHYVSHIRIIYKRDEADNPIKDENGEYVIDHLEHSNGTTLTKNGEPTTDINGPFDQTTGTRPEQFLLMNEDGDTVYAYCIDLQTGADAKKWYRISNLEDNDYYATDDAENHVRAIALNGYWGTAEGTGSITKIREDMKKALADGVIEKEYDITFAIREKIEDKNNIRELEEGEYIKGDYIYKHVTQHVTLTDEIIDAFTEGEALDATQSAIWSYANGSNLTLDGTDRMIVGDLSYASSAMGDSLNKENDFEGAARTRAFYYYLINLQSDVTPTIVINEKNFVKDLSMTVEDKVVGNKKNSDSNNNNDVYNIKMNFTLAFVPDKDSDDLLVHLTDDKGNPIKDKNGKPIIKRLAGENKEGRNHDTILPDENGVYTLTGIQLGENEEYSFDLRLEGTQYLKQGVYVYTAEGGIDKSQTMVGVAEGTNTVDVSLGVTIKFDVDENNHVVAERKWHTQSDPKYGYSDPAPAPAAAAFRLRNTPAAEEVPEETADGLEIIPDEEVPLADAPETADGSLILAAISFMSGIGFAGLNFTPRRKKQ